MVSPFCRTANLLDTAGRCGTPSSHEPEGLRTKVRGVFTLPRIRGAAAAVVDFAATCESEAGERFELLAFGEG